MDIVERLRSDFSTRPLTHEDRLKAAHEIEDLRRELNLQKQRCELWKENSLAGAEEIERLREKLKQWEDSHELVEIDIQKKDIE